jgi:hypothetical protein
MRLHTGGSDAEHRLRDAVNRIGRGRGSLRIVILIGLGLVVLNMLGHSVVAVGAGERAGRGDAPPTQKAGGRRCRRCGTGRAGTRGTVGGSDPKGAP